MEARSKIFGHVFFFSWRFPSVPIFLQTKVAVLEGTYSKQLLRRNLSSNSKLLVVFKHSDPFEVVFEIEVISHSIDKQKTSAEAFY